MPASRDASTLGARASRELTLAGSAPGASPNSFTNGSGKPRDPSMRICTPRRREAATIFMALVIFAMLPTDFMRCLTALGQGG
jgi:hypothetical protein